MLRLWHWSSSRLIPNPRSSRFVRPSSSLAPAAMDGNPLVSTKLWQELKREALFTLYSPFVISVAAGTLPLQAFQRYIAQDAFFLHAFAHAYGRAIENTSEPKLKAQIHELQNAVYDELRMHTSLMQEWNIDVSLSEHAIPATNAYTEFLLDVARGRDVELPIGVDKARLAAFTLGAMTPCMRLYAFIGQELTRVAGHGDDHPYKKWISMYSSSEFEEAATRLEHVLDELAKELMPGDFPVMRKLYARAMRYEFNFFDAHAAEFGSIIPLVTSEDRKVIVVSDFDSTCSVSDSCPVLAELAMLNGPPDIRNKWKSLCESYSKEYVALLAKVFGDETGTEYDYKQVKARLQVVSGFEKQGNSKVFESGLFEGMKLEDVKGAAEKMPLHVGCACVFQRLVQRGVPCHILSVCWSQTFIEAALVKADINNVTIHSNELSNVDGVCDGKLMKRIETPHEKEAVMVGTVLSPLAERGIVIFVGDSLTDLLCLLKADIGIVVGNSPSLDKAAKSFGLNMLPLLSGAVQWQRSETWKKTEGVLYRASGWIEIEAFLLGYEK